MMENNNFKQSLIPLGLIFGANVGVIFSILFAPSYLAISISMGAGIGLLLGTIIYGFYDGKE